MERRPPLIREQLKIRLAGWRRFSRSGVAVSVVAVVGFLWAVASSLDAGEGDVGDVRFLKIEGSRKVSSSGAVVDFD